MLALEIFCAIALAAFALAVIAVVLVIVDIQRSGR